MDALKRAFSPLGFSSGESIIASTDAQNVDFGVSYDHKRAPQQKAAANPENIRGYDVFNATHENVTSDFGVVNYPFGFKGKRKKERAIPVSMGQPEKGARFTAGFTRGVKANNAAVVPKTVFQTGIKGTLDGQSEDSRVEKYFGQLG